MTVRINSISVDGADPHRLAQFRSQLTEFGEDLGNGNAADHPEVLLCRPAWSCR